MAMDRTVSGFHGIDKWIAAVGRAEDGPADPQDARDVLQRKDARPFRVNQAVEAVLEPDAFDAAIGGRLDDRTDDRVESRGVAATGENADACDGCQSC